MNKGAKSIIHDILNYIKHKLYRRNAICKLFDPIKFTPGMKYAGLTISKWHYDYLADKSLTNVLSRDVKDLTTVDEMRYSIKLLIKLNKIMDVKRALIWVRNYFAKKLGRDQSGVKNTNQLIQDKRFFNTYIFEKNINLDDFLNEENKVTKYFKQYKQLDREINAHFLARFYNKNTKKNKKRISIGQNQFIILINGIQARGWVILR